MIRSFIFITSTVLFLGALFTTTGCANNGLHVDADRMCEGSCVSAAVTQADGKLQLVDLYATATKLPWKGEDQVAVISIPDSTTDKLSFRIDVTCDPIKQPIPISSKEQSLTITKVNSGQSAPAFHASTGTLTIERCGTNKGDVIEGRFERVMPADPNADNLGIALVRGSFRATVQ